MSQGNTPNPFSSLPPHQQRKFVPADADLTQPASVTALYQRLLDRPVNSAKELGAWLLDRSEMDAALSQAGSVLYILMTCQTDDPARAGAYQQFVETVQPAVAPLADQLDRKYLQLRQAFALDSDRYLVYDRNLRSGVELFRQPNVPLKTQESLLSQQYQKVMGAMSVKFQDKERTLPEMSKFLQEPDRALREAAWRGVADRMLADKDHLEDLYDQMLALRSRIAANADCSSFIEYQFRSYRRFDYTPDDCRSFHQAVEQSVLPLARKITERRRQKMNLPALRPWDTAVDPENRPPLRPFETSAQLVDGATRIFSQVDPALGEKFAQMDKLGVLDLTSRKGKAPGGYMSNLDEARRPFIFMNAVGVDGDLWTLLHEGGHAFHCLAVKDEPIFAYRHCPLEFAEVASMGMELLADGHLDVFYQPQEQERSRRDHLEKIISLLCWIATIDGFQHWIYSHPGHSRQDRRQAWLETYDRFGGNLDWTGLEEIKSHLWHRQLHIFQVPFYYIEYGIAQLGALQLWNLFRQDPAKALAGYHRALALGGSRPLPELFDAANIKFGFSSQTIDPLMSTLAKELDL